MRQPVFLSAHSRTASSPSIFVGGRTRITMHVCPWTVSPSRSVSYWASVHQRKSKVRSSQVTSVSITRSSGDPMDWSVPLDTSWIVGRALPRREIFTDANSFVSCRANSETDSCVDSSLRRMTSL